MYSERERKEKALLYVGRVYNMLCMHHGILVLLALFITTHDVILTRVLSSFALLFPQLLSLLIRSR